MGELSLTNIVFVSSMNKDARRGKRDEGMHNNLRKKVFSTFHREETQSWSHLSNLPK